VLDGKRVEVGVEHELLAGPGADTFRHRVGEPLQLAEAFDLFDDPLRRLHLEHVPEPGSDRVEGRLAEGQAHAPLRAELVDQQRVFGVLDVREEERRPARFHRAVDDLRDL
jgi:hypothetical protein